MMGRRKLIGSLGCATLGLVLSLTRLHAHRRYFSVGGGQLIVTDPRAVKVTLAALEKRYGWIITYEDPPYEFSGELENVSNNPATVAMDLRSQRLELRDPLPDPSAAPDRFALLTAVINADALVVGHERFALRSSALGIHVVPVSFRDSSGVWSPTHSVLDAPIDMPPEEVTGLQYLQNFCETLARASGKALTPGTVPTRLLASRSISLAATGQPASEVLVALLQSLGTPLTWRLLYSAAAGRGYYLNLVAPG